MLMSVFYRYVSIESFEEKILKMPFASPNHPSKQKGQKKMRAFPPLIEIENNNETRTKTMGLGGYPGELVTRLSNRLCASKHRVPG